MLNDTQARFVETYFKCFPHVVVGAPEMDVERLLTEPPVRKAIAAGIDLLLAKVAETGRRIFDLPKQECIRSFSIQVVRGGA